MSKRVMGSEAPIKLFWNDICGEGFVMFNEDFYNYHWVTRADMLKDIIAELQEEYDELLSEEMDDEPDTDD